MTPETVFDYWSGEGLLLYHNWKPLKTQPHGGSHPADQSTLLIPNVNNGL